LLRVIIRRERRSRLRETVHGPQSSAGMPTAQYARSRVEKTHQPILGTLSDKDLAQLCKLVRDRRDRAQQIAARQRREMRGKSDPKGSRAASGNTGTRVKGDVLAAAVERLNEEVTRRVAKTSRQRSIDNATRVLEMHVQPHPASADKAGKGKKLKAQVPSRAPHNSQGGRDQPTYEKHAGEARREIATHVSRAQITRNCTLWLTWTSAPDNVSRNC
jgi:hypothetical protein